MSRGHDDISRRRCHIAMILLNDLIPNFEARATAAEDIHSFCSPVRLTSHFHADQPDMKTSCKQVPMTHAAMIQADSKLWSQIGSTPASIQTQYYMPCVPTRRSNVASTTMLRDASFAQSIMIGTIQCTSCEFFSSLQSSQPLIGLI